MAKHLTERQFLHNLAGLATNLKGELAFHTGICDFEPDQASMRRRRAKKDLLWFGQTYFAHYIRPHSNGRPVVPSELHLWLCQTLPQLGLESKGARLAIAAPRGEAKSTWLLIWVIWCVLHRSKTYILYIMDVAEQAAAVLDAIKSELEINPALAVDYPDEIGVGPVWQGGVIVTRSGIKIQARGARQRVRGLKHGAHRPDLAILDDLENDIQVENPMQRDRLTDWLLSAVDNLGEAGAPFDVVMIGTVLHPDSVLRRMQALPLWQDKIFQAIQQWPDRMDLWEAWENILRTHNAATAQDFFEAHHAEMTRGSAVSWPDKRPLIDLMETRIKVGAARFDKEYQNDPVPRDGIFPTPIFWSKRQDCWQYFGAVDPSLGRTSRSDPSALLIGGLDREQGILDVVEAQIRRRPPDQIVADVLALQQDYGCVIWFVESIQFQEFFRTELQRRAAIQGVPLAAKPVVPSTDKHLRISRLQPLVAEGLIRFHSSQTTLLEQLRHFPTGDHDDGPDALEMLWSGALSHRAHPSEIKGIGARRFNSQSSSASTTLSGFQL